MIIIMHVDRVKTNVVAYVNETVLRVRSSNEYESVCLRVRAHFTVFHFKKGQNFQFSFTHFLIHCINEYQRTLQSLQSKVHSQV